MSTKETAVTEVIVDGVQAGQELINLGKEADKLHEKLEAAMRMNDHQSVKQLKNEIGKVNKEMKATQTAVMDVDKVLKNMSGSSIKDLTAAKRKLTAELRNLTRGTTEYINKSKNLSKINSELSKIRNEMGGFRGALSGLPGIFGTMARSAQAFGKSMFAVFTNPVILTITLLAAALYSVGKAFVKTDEGGRKYAMAMDMLKTNWSVYLQFVSQIGKYDGQIFAHFYKANKAAEVYSGTMERLNDSIINEASQIAQDKAEMAELTLIYNDQTNSIETKIEALEKFQALEKKTLAFEVNAAKVAYEEKIKKTAAEYNIDAKALNHLVQANDHTATLILKIDKKLAVGRNAMGDEEYQELEKLYAEKFKLKEESDKALRKSTTKLTGFYKEQDDTKLKNVKENAKKEADYRKNIYEEQIIQLKKSHDDVLADLNEMSAILDEAIQQSLANEENIDRYNNNRLLENAQYRREIAEFSAKDESELRNIQLENDRQNEIDIAEKTGADVLLIEKKYALLKNELDKKTLEENLRAKADFAGNLAELLGEQTALGKAAAVAQATISTYLAATEAYASLASIPVIGPVLGAAAAATAVGLGLKNIKEILSVNTAFAEGRYPVTGPQDGKTYMAGYAGKPVTGIYDKPMVGLFSERMPEMVIDGPTTRNLQINRPDIISSIMAARSGQFAAGRYPDQGGGAGGGQDLSPLINSITKLNNLLDGGIAAKFSYTEVRNIRDRTSDITKIENRTRGK